MFFVYFNFFGQSEQIDMLIFVYSDFRSYKLHIRIVLVILYKNW